MKHKIIIAGACMLLTALGRGEGQTATASETLIWMNQPAEHFTASVPLGNGRLGAMLFGGTETERLVLNESSVWSGSPQEADRPEAHKVLPEIRRLLRAGKNPEAEALVNAHFTCQGPGSAGGQYGCYQVLGNLWLDFQTNTNAPVTNYRRELDLSNAIAKLEYQRAGVTFRRELFVSAPDEVMVLSLGADQPRQLSFSIRLDRPERFQTICPAPNEMLMIGQLDNGTDGNGLQYAARIRVLNQGGNVSVQGNRLQVEQADAVTVLIAAATDYRGFAGRQLTDPIAVTKDDLARAAKKSASRLRAAHVADYQKYFSRTALQLGPPQSDISKRPTPERIVALQNGGNDPGLSALYFNFGRYLLISSSRPGGLPANLQGLWAEEIKTPWTGDWHLDVNVQMNYWPAEVANLSELHQPLFALIDRCKHRERRRPGLITTRAAGWRTSSPIRGASRRRANPRTGARPTADQRGCVSICGITGCSRATRNSSRGRIRSSKARRDFTRTS